MRLYALLDRKAGSYSSFHVERSDAQASRGFADAVNQPNSVLGKYPDDFALVALAEVNEDVEVRAVLPIDVVEILTAAQVVSLRPQAQGELALVKEA